METSVKQRLILFLDSIKMNKSDFGKSIGVSSAYVTSIRESISPQKLKSIALNFPELNIDWLLTGNGDMLINNSHNFDEEYWKNIVSSQQKTIERQAKTIEEQSNVIASLISQKDKRAV